MNAQMYIIFLGYAVSIVDSAYTTLNPYYALKIYYIFELLQILAFQYIL